MSPKQHLQFILISISTALVSTMIGQNFVDGIFYYRNIYFGNRGHRYCARIRYARLWRSSSKRAHLVVFHNRSDAGNIIRICLRAIQSK